MGGIRIEGASSNVAEVTANNNLKVQLPTAAAQVGSVRMLSENDSGSIIGTPQLRAPETGPDYRLRVGADTLLDSHFFSESSLHINKFNVNINASQISSANGYLLLNSGAATNASAYATIYTSHFFQIFNGNAPLYVETSFRIDNVMNSVVTFEWGMVSRGWSGLSTTNNMDGVFFRNTANGLVGVVAYQGTQITTDVMLASLTLGTTYTTGIVIGNREVQFWVNDIMYVAPIAIGNAMPLISTSACWFSKYNQTASGGTGCVAKIGGYGIYQTDVVANYKPEVVAAISGNSMYIQQGGQGRSQNFSVSAAPPSITLTANTGPALNWLFSSFVYPAALSVAESDFPIVAFDPKYLSAIDDTHPAKSFVCTGVEIGDMIIASTVTGGPLVAQWFCGFKSNSQALNGTESTQWSGSQRAVRSIPMRTQTIPASAVAGSTIAGFRFDLSASPLLISPHDYLHVYVRFPAGTNITAGSIRQTISLLGYFI